MYKRQTAGLTMEVNVKIECTDKPPEKRQVFDGLVAKSGCKYSRIQLLREGFLVFLNINDGLSRLSETYITSHISKKGLIFVEPQKLTSINLGSNGISPNGYSRMT